VYEALLERLKSSWVAQPDKPEETPESTLRALCLASAGRPVSAHLATTAELPELDPSAQERLVALVEQRGAGVPLAHLTGRQHFMGLEMLAGPGALIPREETEILGRGALALATSLAEERGSLTMLDICTGSGNLPLAVAAQEPRCRAFGSDLSEQAVELARRNAGHLGLETKVEFRQGDMFGAFDSEDFLGKVDLVTCNPPYISSAKVKTMPQEISRHEPALAFDGGFMGVKILMRLINEAPRFLKPDSYLCFEVGLGQGKGMLTLLKQANAFRDVQTLLDGAGQVRALTART